MNRGNGRPMIGITVGDPAGIGPEIVVKALQDERVRQSVRPVVYADRVCLEQTLGMLGVEMELNAGSAPGEGGDADGVIDYVDVGSLD